MGDVTTLPGTQETYEAQPPEIRLTQGEMRRILDEAADALVRAEVPVYRRGGTLVRTTTADDLTPDGVRRPREALTICRATPEWLRLRLSDAATFQRWDHRIGKKGGWRTVDPPQSLASDMIAACDELPFPALRAVARHPVPRTDGTVAAEPGYDRDTRLLLDFDGAAFPEVPDQPDREDAIAAAGRLRHLLRNFPFADDTDRAVALSALMTAVVRPVISQAPMHAFDAPVPGSGKSLLAHTAAVLATGDTAPMASIGSNDEEAEKRLDSAMLAGDPVLVLDNVDRPIGGERLCSILTEPSVRLRVLGRSDMTTVPCSTLVMATGNNLKVRGDVSRRTLVCRLDPGMERPELRSFDQDVLADVRANRGQFVADVLTIIRAHACAGWQRAGKPLGSYDAWNDLVREALLFAGEADPVDSQERLRADDPALEALRNVIVAWRSAFATAATVKEAVNADDEALRDALMEVAGTNSGSISARKVGNYLSKHRDRIVDGLQLRHMGVRKRAAVWTVRPVGRGES